jgi:hypothetical protein
LEINTMLMLNICGVCERPGIKWFGNGPINTFLLLKDQDCKIEMVQ